MKPLRRPDAKVVSRLISSLEPEERLRLEPFLENVTLQMRERLATAGEQIASVYFPNDAITSTLMELPEGDIVEVGLMGSEGIVGLDLLYRQTQAVTTVIAQIPGTAARMSAHDFLREVVDRGGPFYALLLRYARAFLGMVSQCAACNASHSVEQRFARWLLMVHDRVSRDDFPLTHEFAALMLGVRRASVTQAASMLRQAGAIDYKVGEVTVCDRKVLEAVTCGCYVLMREMAESVFENEHGAGGVSLYSFDQ